MLSQFEVLYPTEGVVRAAVRSAAAYELSWFDAHLWAFAEFYDLSVIYSEDFEHERRYGTVHTIDPFRDPP